MNPNQVNRNQNPLLSCAVTGGFDEFTGSGIVLAAAAGKYVRNKVKEKRFFQVNFFIIFLLFCTQSNVKIAE